MFDVWWLDGRLCVFTRDKTRCLPLAAALAACWRGAARRQHALPRRLLPALLSPTYPSRAPACVNTAAARRAETCGIGTHLDVNHAGARFCRHRA